VPRQEILIKFNGYKLAGSELTPLFQISNDQTLLAVEGIELSDCMCYTESKGHANSNKAIDGT